MGAALIFMMLCWQIPKLFAAVLGGSPALSGGDLVATATGVIAGAATVASFGAGSVAAAAGGAAALRAPLGAGSGSGVSSAVATVGGRQATLDGREEEPFLLRKPAIRGVTKWTPETAEPAHQRIGACHKLARFLSSMGGDSLSGSGFEKSVPHQGSHVLRPRCSTGEGRRIPGMTLRGVTASSGP